MILNTCIMQCFAVLQEDYSKVGCGKSFIKAASKFWFICQYKNMRGSRKDLTEGVQLWQRFFSWWGKGGSKYHYKRVIIGPPAKRHWNGVSLAYRWWPNIECWLGSFVIFRGSGPVLLRNPIVLWFFSGGNGGRNPLFPTPSLDPRMNEVILRFVEIVCVYLILINMTFSAYIGQWLYSFSSKKTFCGTNWNFIRKKARECQGTKQQFWVFLTTPLLGKTHYFGHRINIRLTIKSLPWWTIFVL